MPDPVPTPEPPAAADAAAARAPPRRGILRRALRVIGWIAVATVCFALAFWSVLAVFFTDLSGGKSPRYVAAALTVIIQVGCLFFLRPPRFRLAAFGVSVVLIVAWF